MPPSTTTTTPVTTSQRSLKAVLKALVLTPQQVPADDVAWALGEIMAERATATQVAAFMVSLRAHGTDHEPAVIAACARVLHDHGVPVPAPEPQQPSSTAEIIVDMVGTGGDGHDTFNVSTTAALVAAGAGACVAKHGSRASSSACGSADLLEAAGCAVAAVGPTHVHKILAKTRFCFLFAPRFHPAMRHAAPVRRELGIPSLFNVLGPLANPARPHRAVIGVYAPSLGPVVARALHLLGVDQALVVCGHEGLDEISPAGPSDAWRLHSDGSIVHFTLHPTADFGLPAVPLAAVAGGATAADNVQILTELLQNKRNLDSDPVALYVILNAAALLVVSGTAKDWKHGVQLARNSIAQGKAWETLQAYKTLTVDASKQRDVEMKDAPAAAAVARK
ncbi:anthranilate phosphoribosyltransferase [Allomyces javanicus]|nr:anthranilate phosphoribosyltransferase [Allomyces javanicus]